MKKRHLFYVALGSLLISHSVYSAQTFCNPLNLDYRFSLRDDQSHRTAADPVVVIYKGEYFLFASKSGGYWWSTDFQDWTFVAPTTDIEIERFAPAVIVLGDKLIYTSSQGGAIYESTDPKSGNWTRIAKPRTWQDPALFLDDDGRVYCYHGLQQNGSIKVVELDPNNKFELIGREEICLTADFKNHGFEQAGNNNEVEAGPYIEGAWMSKHNGIYYLEYSAPGTQYRSYANGCYTSTSPKGPFTYAPHSPTTARHRGFVTGIGHGCTFKDLNGHLWNISTVAIADLHMFERRLALFPVEVDPDGLLHTISNFGDYPHYLPGTKPDPAKGNLTGWNLLSRNKKASSSSVYATNGCERAFDEDIKTMWSAATDHAGEWLAVDLGVPCEVRAIQVNFAEVDATAKGRREQFAHKYLLEASSDGKTWSSIHQKTDEKDTPHDYIELNQSLQVQYIRLTNQGPAPGGGKFSVRDLRIFGTKAVHLPGKVQNVSVKRNPQDRRQAVISWDPVPMADGYQIRYGIAADKLYGHYQFFSEETNCTINSLNADQDYQFVIDSYNEAGLTKGE